MRTWLGLPVLCLLALPAQAEGPGGPAGGPAPAQNFTELHAETEWVARQFAEAARARAAGRHEECARRLQSVVEAVAAAEPRLAAEPSVRAVAGTSVYEGAWLVARHEAVRGGQRALDAHAAEFGAAANALLERGRRGDLAALVTVARHHLPHPAGRRAALVLAERALERGDADEALEWLATLEDLEWTTTEGEAALAPWRNARLACEARARARSPDQVEAWRNALQTRAAQAGAPDRGVWAVAPSLEGPPPRTREWWTRGGHPTRNAVPESLGTALELAWSHGPGSLGQLADTIDPADEGLERPSTFLPPQGVVCAGHAIVSDGESLRAIHLESGRLAGWTRFQSWHAHGHDVDADRRTRFGWIEGHGLTVSPFDQSDPDAGWLVFASVPDGRPFASDLRSDDAFPREDHLECFRWQGQGFEPLWSTSDDVGGEGSPPALPSGMRLYGSPLLYRGKLWAGGVLPSATNIERFESWMVALDPYTGTLISRTHLGTGTPVRPMREDEIMPTAPAGHRGQVVLGTALGIVAAVSAHDGRIAWIHRYDRDVEVDRHLRGIRRREDRDPRSMSFSNGPPRLGYGRCVLAPTDGRGVIVLADRPMGKDRLLRMDVLHRQEDFVDFLPESVAALLAPVASPAAPATAGPAQSGSIPAGAQLDLVLVGKATGIDLPGSIATRRDISSLAQVWGAVPSTAFGSGTYGESLCTAGELFVPTREGILVFDLESGKRSALLHHEAEEPNAMRPYGNLIPVPGRGLLAVGATTVSYWRLEPTGAPGSK